VVSEYVSAYSKVVLGAAALALLVLVGTRVFRMAGSRKAGDRTSGR
jgi:hypothetical protein